MLVKLNDQDGILHAKMSGPVSLHEVLGVLRELLDTCAERKLSKALVETLGVTGSLSALERYAIGSAWASYVQRVGINPWVAIVGVPPMVDQFAADVANNRGTRATVFTDTKSALTWLSSLHAQTLGGAG